MEFCEITKKHTTPDAVLLFRLGLELETDVPYVKKGFLSVVTLCKQGQYGCLLKRAFSRLTPGSREFLEKLMRLCPVRKFPTFDGTQASLLRS